MYHSFPERIIRPVKRHSCYGCGQVIEKGVPCLKQSGIHEGEGYFNGWFCERCASFIKAKSSFDWSYHEEGLYQGDLLEYDDYKTHEVTPLNQLKLN